MEERTTLDAFFSFGLVFYLLIILVKMLAIFLKGLHIANQFSSEVWLQGDQFILYLCSPGQELFPGVTQSIHLINLFFGH